MVMMKTSYLRALEKKAEWLHWFDYERHPANYEFDTSYALALAAFGHVLQVGGTMFMNKRFCDLVDYARRTVPDDLEFEKSWLPSQFGFLWLETPFSVPHSSYEFGEVTNYLHRHSESIRRYIKFARFPAILINHQYMIDPHVLADCIESRVTEAA
jgi:hypothetical protein